jgi:hypothetical protein
MNALTDDKKKNYIVSVKHKTLGYFQSQKWEMSEAEAAEFVMTCKDSDSDLYFENQGGSIIMFRPSILNESIIFLKEMPEESK